jgi:hypothetical protein
VERICDFVPKNVKRYKKTKKNQKMDTAGEFAGETWRFSQLFGEKSINVEVSEGFIFFVV